MSFKLGDLVWVRVAGHPRWPAQILDAATALPSALSAKKKGCEVYVAFFGDGSVGFTKASELQSFAEELEANESVDCDDQAFRKAVADAKATLADAAASGGVVPCPAPRLVVAQLEANPLVVAQRLAASCDAGKALKALRQLAARPPMAAAPSGEGTAAPSTSAPAPAGLSPEAVALLSSYLSHRLAPKPPKPVSVGRGKKTRGGDAEEGGEDAEGAATPKEGGGGGAGEVEIPIASLLGGEEEVGGEPGSKKAKRASEAGGATPAQLAQPLAAGR